MELKKSYKGFIIWMIFFLLSMIGCVFLPFNDGIIVGRISLNICIIDIVILTFVIYKKEYIYWYTGDTYEKAVEAGSERRRAYAWRHFVRFGLFAFAYLIYSIAAHFFGLSFVIDAFVMTVGIIIVAISTVQFKL